MTIGVRDFSISVSWVAYRKPLPGTCHMSDQEDEGSIVEIAFESSTSYFGYESSRIRALREMTERGGRF